MDATIVANNVAHQIEGKVAYRKAIRSAIFNSMKNGAEGIKIQISGRLNGAEIARSEMYKEGRTPLHTFRADIDYCHAEALTKVGLIGIKVWICRGEVYGKKDLEPKFENERDKRNFAGRRNEGERRPRRNEGERRPRRRNNENKK